MKSIQFTNFNIYADNTGFECNVYASDHDKNDIIYFKFNQPIGYISHDSIALTLSTLCGIKKFYDNVYIELSISQKCYEYLKINIQSNIKVLNTDYNDKIDRTLYNEICLNFSGGLDSLAFYSLIKDSKPKLVSINFGGGYSREYEFFKNFNTLILNTNIRTLGYTSDKKTWTFMGIASLLAIDFLKIKYVLFGTVDILDSDFKEKKHPYMTTYPFSFFNCGKSAITFLNEIHTMIIVYYYYSYIIEDIFNSIANKTSEKYIRKRLELCVAKQFFKLSTDYEFKLINYDINSLNNRWDLILERLIIGKLFYKTNNIYNKFIIDNNLTLNFITKFDNKQLGILPSNVVNEVKQKLYMIGFTEYLENDYYERKFINDNIKTYFNKD